MSTIAFGIKKSAVRRCGLFLLINLALGGIAAGVHGEGKSTAIIGILPLWMICKGIFSGCDIRKKYVDLVIRNRGKEYVLRGLYDTGNSLTDPITGEQVTVLGRSTASKLTGLTSQQLSDPLKTMIEENIKGLRLVPYASVGNVGGFMLAIRIPEMMVDSRKCSGIVAFAPVDLEGCDALIGGDFFE